MSDRAKAFVDAWIEDHIHPTGYEPEGDQSEAALRATECWHQADLAQISRGEIEHAVGPLVDYMAAAIESKNDDEVQRLIAKHD